MLRSRGARGARLRRPGSSTSCPGAAWPGRREEFDGVEVVAFADAAAFEDRPAEHHARREGVWGRGAGKASGIASATDGEPVDVGPRRGWISGRRRGLDDRHCPQGHGPRSRWSRVGVEKVAALAAAGRMREPGPAESGGPGRTAAWARACASQARAVVPGDLAAALAADRVARAAFDALDRAARSLVLLPLLRAAMPEARRTRLERGGAGARGERASRAAGAMTRSGRRAPRGPRTARPLG
ncbi:YdeI/OmpD-associated family protein [Streptomyces alfalfae]|uniref:YdeI/OmpD-associated family protein n=1 Tax=Streptomyces alfalfae TaxID=1642299 RepID=A0A7T4PPL1_9ACTN|nr:YdeI/OmpD-associated family protein [Streptomyces alfalfae]